MTVVMDETVERSVTNMPMQGQVRIVKTDAETGGSLAGAVFTVIPREPACLRMARKGAARLWRSSPRMRKGWQSRLC